MDVMQAIRDRRSVRHYKPNPVKPEDLQAVLEAARLAPSWANTQCWKFVVVRDPATKARLAGALNPGNPATAAITEAPIVIVACAETGKSGFKRGEVCTDKGDWFMFDVGIAMQNMALAALLARAGHRSRRPGRRQEGRRGTGPSSRHRVRRNDAARLSQRGAQGDTAQRAVRHRVLREVRPETRGLDPCTVIQPDGHASA